MYKSKKPFVFLPGHRALIFGIKEELLKRSENKKLKIGRRQQASEKLLNENELRIMLQNQLATYAKDIKVKMQHFINEMIVEQTDNQTFARASVSCSICETINYLRYENGWRLSNIFKHMRNHLTKNDKKAAVGNSKDENSIASKVGNAQNALEGSSNNHAKLINGQKGMFIEEMVEVTEYGDLVNDNDIESSIEYDPDEYLED